MAWRFLSCGGCNDVQDGLDFTERTTCFDITGQQEEQLPGFTAFGKLSAPVIPENEPLSLSRAQESLFEVAFSGDTKVLEGLLAKLDDAQVMKVVNMPEHRDGNTAMHIAAEEGNDEIVRVLIGSRANPSRENFHGQTPLDLAAEGTEAHALLEAVTRPETPEQDALPRENLELEPGCEDIFKDTV
eukprot:TRINITY_DN63683_c0_g1_i1.p1 TRINITY_DN63683_c0_g1~~TRINITY_DN63683_c0_g1_i1.p1  ORF type:complete len:186 (+),score=49.42 TRINITY_DN63683_c0_g1_i1:88-645(+)